MIAQILAAAAALAAAAPHPLALRFDPHAVTLSPPPPAPPRVSSAVVTLELPVAEANEVVAALRKRTIEDAGDTYDDVRRQAALWRERFVAQAEADAAARAAAAPAPAAKPAHAKR